MYRFCLINPSMITISSSSTTMNIITTKTTSFFKTPKKSSLFYTFFPFSNLGCVVYKNQAQNVHKFHKFSVSASIGSVLSSGNVIAASAAAGSGTLHGAVTSAITQVAVTAVAIASGACLSTKVDFLWPKMDDQPGSLILDGVDVTGYTIFSDPKAGGKGNSICKDGSSRPAAQDWGSLLNTLYSHWKNYSRISPNNREKVDTVVAGILHDVVDDTCESLQSIEREFDADVARLVAGVSKISFINQLLRRNRRVNVNQAKLSHEEADSLRVMLLGMVNDPRVVLIKLADRLHNMRTIYALPLAKAEAVAQETLAIWCSLASRLGLWALKSELEDLCFAVLQPQVFLRMRADLASIWKADNWIGPQRRNYAKSTSISRPNGKNVTSKCEEKVQSDPDSISMKVLLQAVLPFDLVLDRKKRSHFLNNLGSSTEKQTTPKVVHDAGIALASLVICEEALERELFISTSYIPGMEVTLSGRLKSLYSIYSKMKRKYVGIDKVYDARALRVIVGDKKGTLHGQAVQGCYSLLDIVHRLWTPIDGEFDDYIVNPKPSGYQSLHTAVQGPDNSPLEVQIRTQRMHDYAEHGLAAHWLYKETEDVMPANITAIDSKITPTSYLSKDMEEEGSIEDEAYKKYNSLKEGHPVLRVEAGHLLAAVIVRVDNIGRELLVAVGFGLAAPEAVADRRSSNQIKRWEAYARLYKKVSDEWWCEPGHGDWGTCLEKYTLCRDGIYHKEDQFQRLLPTFIQVIELTEQEETEYWAVISSVMEDKPIPPYLSNSMQGKQNFVGITGLTMLDSGLNNKVSLLRTMLQWEEELCSDAGLLQPTQEVTYVRRGSVSLNEVVIVCWPHGEIMRLTSGSTAADAARRRGLDGKLVSVNGQLVLPGTELKDGDVVEVKM